MAILIDQHTTVVVQGITGKEGQKITRAMLDYGTNVVGGVRPGKGGERIEGVPVFNTLAEMVAQHQHVDTSVVVVPPPAAKMAIMEAIDANISFINVLVERVPIQDIAYCLEAAKERGVHILGPSSLGYISPGIGRVGMIGGPKPLVHEIFVRGDVGIISRSGGMTNEVSWQIRKAGLGQSTAVHVGGDLLMGFTYADILALFEKDELTRAVAIFGEHGGMYEFEIVDMIQKGSFTKPLAIYIGGAFAEHFPQGMQIGHAGALVERGSSAKEKVEALAAVGVRIAEQYEDLAALVQAHGIDGHFI